MKKSPEKTIIEKGNKENLERNIGKKLTKKIKGLELKDFECNGNSKGNWFKSDRTWHEEIPQTSGKILYHWPR